MLKFGKSCVGYVLLHFTAAIALGKSWTCKPANSQWGQHAEQMASVLLGIGSNLSGAAAERELGLQQGDEDHWNREETVTRWMFLPAFPSL